MPVDGGTLAAFALAAAALVIAPGPDTLLILRCALAAPAAGYAAVLGIQLGLLIHTALAVLGLSLLIARSPVLFNTVALAGAAYLAWLGIRGLHHSTGPIAAGKSPALTPLQACRDAMLTNLLNPKVLLLFLALYPNFVAYDRGRVPAQLTALSATLIAINIAWQAPLAWAANHARRWLVRPATRTATSRVASAILLGFAVFLLYDHIR